MKMQCEICGKEENLVKSKIEGTIMNVCIACSSYGERIKTPTFAPPTNHRRMINKPKNIEQIKENFAALIRNKREQLGLKQEDFAKKINEKESIIHKIETGHFTPSISLAKKIERFLEIKLVEEVAEEDTKIAVNQSTSDGAFTLGDAIKFKKK